MEDKTNKSLYWHHIQKENSKEIKDLNDNQISNHDENHKIEILKQQVSKENNLKISELVDSEILEIQKELYQKLGNFKQNNNK